MRFFRPTLRIDYEPGRALLLRSRPSLLYCLALAAFLVPTLLCWASLQAGAIAASLVFAFPAFLLGVLVWMSWSDVMIPQFGRAIRWRDGLFTKTIPAGNVLAAQVDSHVQPRLHKGPSATAFVRVWIADRRLMESGQPADPWHRVFTFEQNANTNCNVPADKQVPQIQSNLRELGYPAEIPKGSEQAPVNR